ncbi:MAG: hypothetical protein ACLRMZ_21085 [Blautia marasmi]
MQACFGSHHAVVLLGAWGLWGRSKIKDRYSASRQAFYISLFQQKDAGSREKQEKEKDAQEKEEGLSG